MARAGPEQLGRLLDEHGAALVLYAQQWCASPEDVVQEAFLKLVREPVLPANVVGWLYRVVRNGAISAARSASRRVRREAAAASIRQAWFQPAAELRIDAEAAAEALELLPSEQRETLVARVWGGLSFQEIAELTGTSVSTAHRRYQTGLSALRERLGVACPKNESCPES
jgi:RNA polymerase sigma-70 factor (ECF subfamily)